VMKGRFFDSLGRTGPRQSQRLPARSQPDTSHFPLNRLATPTVQYMTSTLPLSPSSLLAGNAAAVYYLVAESAIGLVILHQPSKSKLLRAVHDRIRWSPTLTN